MSRRVLTPRAVIWLSHLSSEILDGSSRAKEKVLLQGPNNYNSAITDQTLFPWPCPQLEEQLWLFWLKAQAAKVSLSAGATRSWRLHRIRDSFAIKQMTLCWPGATLVWLFGFSATKIHTGISSEYKSAALAKLEYSEPKDYLWVPEKMTFFHWQIVLSVSCVSGRAFHPHLGYCIFLFW